MKFYAIIASFFLALFMTSCSTEAAEKVADEFHQKLDAGEYDYIVENIADLEGTITEENWRSFFEVVASWGPQTNRTKAFGFNKQYKNGFTTVKLSYTFEVEAFGLMHERVVLVDRDGQYKVFNVMMDKDEQVVIDGTVDF